MRGRNEKSLAALAKLRRRSDNNSYVQLEWKGILAETQFQKQLHQREYRNTHPIWVELKQWAALFRPKHFRRTLIALAIPFFQQVRLTNAAPFYVGSSLLILLPSSPGSTLLCTMLLHSSGL